MVCIEGGILCNLHAATTTGLTVVIPATVLRPEDAVVEQAWCSHIGATVRTQRMESRACAI